MATARLLAPITQTPAERARAVQGIRPVTVAVPPPRVPPRSVGDVSLYDVFAASNPSGPTITLTPPSNVIRRQAGLGIPSVRDVAEATFGVLAGAAITATFVTLVPPGSKWIAALTTGVLGVVVLSTSPLGTIPEELGMGALAASVAGLFFEVTGQFQAKPATASTPAAGGIAEAGAVTAIPSGLLLPGSSFLPAA